MNKLNYLEKLLDGAEVAWLPLGDIGEFIRGNGLQKKDFTETGVGCIHYGQLHTYYGVSSTTTKTFVSEGFAKKSRKAKPGNLVIATTSEDDDGLCKAVAWMGSEDIAVSSDACIYDHALNSKYVAYFFQTEQFQKQKKPYITGTKVRRVNADNLSKIQIPIPCPDDPKKSLEIQAEIVRTLDTFTELTTELTTRKKQYHYYRDQLLTFDEGEVEWKPLGDIAIIGTGSRNTNEAVLDGNFPFFVRSQEPRTIDEFEFDETAIITAGDGVGVGKVFHYISGKYALHQRAYRVVVTDNNVNSRYLFHYIRTNFAQYLKKTSVHASVTSLRKPMFEKYLTPVPSPEEQARIVAILDKFDTLTHSISEGLPREIKLRQQQYEYYRDLLLAFPKPEEGNV